MITVGREIDVVDPDFRGLLNSDGVSGISKNLLDGDISDNDVGHLDDANADTSES